MHAFRSRSGFNDMAAEAGAPAAPAAKRPRFVDAEGSLVNVLASYFTTPTKVSYGDLMSAAKVEPRLIVQHARLLGKLRALQSNLAFKKASMKDAMYLVGQQKMSDWRFSQEDLLDWHACMAERVRTMCAHYAAALRRKARPKWVTEVLAIQGTSSCLEPAPRTDDTQPGRGDDEETLGQPRCPPAHSPTHETVTRGQDTLSKGVRQFLCWAVCGRVGCVPGLP